jgi:hypothetical protein
MHPAKLADDLRHLTIRQRVGAPSLIVVTVAYTVFGVCLIAQPDRWAYTPAYGLLLDIAHQWVWGTVYLGISFLLAATAVFPVFRSLAVIAHTAAIALTIGWLGAFLIRYLTDPHTTIVNVVSWGVYLALLIQSAIKLDDRRPTVAAALKVARENIRGKTGARGPAGVKGADSSVPGPTGATGAAGPTGERGPAGDGPGDGVVGPDAPR